MAGKTCITCRSLDTKMHIEFRDLERSGLARAEYDLGMVTGKAEKAGRTQVISWGAM